MDRENEPQSEEEWFDQQDQFSWNEAHEGPLGALK